MPGEAEILAALPQQTSDALLRIIAAANKLVQQRDGDSVFAQSVQKFTESPLKQLLTAARFVSFDGKAAAYEFPPSRVDAAAGSASSSAPAVRLSAVYEFQDIGQFGSNHGWSIWCGSSSGNAAVREGEELFVMKINSRVRSQEDRFAIAGLHQWLHERAVIASPPLVEGEESELTEEEAAQIGLFIRALFAPHEAAKLTCGSSRCGSCSLENFEGFDGYIFNYGF